MFVVADRICQPMRRSYFQVPQALSNWPITYKFAILSQKCVSVQYSPNYDDEIITSEHIVEVWIGASEDYIRSMQY